MPGQTIVIVNESGLTRSIGSAGDGTFESGPIAPASRYALAFPGPGTWSATDDATPTAHTATITVGRLELEGDEFTNANSAIPDLSAPDGPVVVHPDLGLEVTRNRILVTFTDGASVPQANAALEAAGLTIVGGNRDARLLVTEVADAGTPSLDYMQSTLDLLRAQPAVRTAAYDVSLNPETALPRPADPDPGTAVGEAPYQWETFIMDDDTIRGDGTNYGLKHHEGDVEAGTSAQYTIEIANGGPDVAQGVVVTDVLADGVTFVRSTGSGWTCSALTLDTVSCALSINGERTQVLIEQTPAVAPEQFGEFVGRVTCEELGPS